MRGTRQKKRESKRTRKRQTKVKREQGGRKWGTKSGARRISKCGRVDRISISRQSSSKVERQETEAGNRGEEQGCITAAAAELKATGSQSITSLLPRVRFR